MHVDSDLNIHCPLNISLQTQVVEIIKNVISKVGATNEVLLLQSYNGLVATFKRIARQNDQASLSVGISLSLTVSALALMKMFELSSSSSYKHYAVSNHEHCRMTVDAIVDERTLREIYLPAFERTVKQAQP